MYENVKDETIAEMLNMEQFGYTCDESDVSAFLKTTAEHLDYELFYIIKDSGDSPHEHMGHMVGLVEEIARMEAIINLIKASTDKAIAAHLPQQVIKQIRACVIGAFRSDLTVRELSRTMSAEYTSARFVTGTFYSVWDDDRYTIKSRCTIDTATREIVQIDTEKRSIITDDPDANSDNIDDIVQVLDEEFVIIDSSPDIRHVACDKSELVAGDTTTFWHN